MDDRELIAQGAVLGPVTDTERWEAGADPTTFIDTHGMARWRYVMTDAVRQPAFNGLQQALPAARSRQ